MLFLPEGWRTVARQLEHGGNGLVSRCADCILPENLPSVNLNEQGVCDYCTAAKQNHTQVREESVEEGRAALAKLFAPYRGKGRYDCLVPISGGKDSMYLLYLLVGEFKLNVLAYTFDNGFQSERAVQNIQRSVSKLGVDLIRYKPREDVLFELYRTFLVRAGEFCSPCNTMISAFATSIARQYRIRLIANGGDGPWDSGVTGMSQSHYCDRRYYLNVIKGYVAKKAVRNYIIPSPLLNGFWRLTGTGPVIVFPLEHLHPGPQRMQEILERELGWQAPSDELQHGDCRLNTLKDYLMNRKWGFSELTQAYAAMVRMGEITREEGLRRAESEEVRTPPSVLPEFLEKIGVSPEEFEASRHRHFTDFPNYERSLLFGLAKRVLKAIRPSR